MKGETRVKVTKKICILCKKENSLISQQNEWKIEIRKQQVEIIWNIVKKELYFTVPHKHTKLWGIYKRLLGEKLKWKGQGMAKMHINKMLAKKIMRESYCIMFI